MAGPVHAYDSELGLYAPINPFNDGFLERGIHHIYFEEIGNPEGIPVLFLHGGPGAGCAPAHRRLFDPQRYRVILMDQRGCGRSEPFASIQENTTQDLISSEVASIGFHVLILIYAIQLVVFLISYALKTEHYYDLTGGITYISVVLYTVYQIGNFIYNFFFWKCFSNSSCTAKYNFF